VLIERNKIYYEQNRDAILKTNRTKYEEQLDTEEWKECRRVVNKRYAEKRKERLRQEKGTPGKTTSSIKCTTIIMFIIYNGNMINIIFRSV